MTETMRQVAPYPTALVELVERCRYKSYAGWTFTLCDIDRGQGSEGLTLIIQRVGPDTYDPSKTLRVNHFMLVPPAAYDTRSWMEWLFDQIMLVELHEAMEEFKLKVADDVNATQPGVDRQLPEYRPYAPSHGPGNNPYIRREPGGTDLDRRIMFTGEVSS